MRIKILMVTLVLLLTGCFSQGQVDNKNLLVDDGAYVAGISLPRGVKNKTYIGNGWFKFELYGECFIFADKGRTGIMSKIKCEN